MSKKTVLKNRLREIRKSRNLSQEELAKMAGLSLMTISSIETERYVPNAGIAAEICLVLDVSFDDVFYLEKAIINDKEK